MSIDLNSLPDVSKLDFSLPTDFDSVDRDKSNSLDKNEFIASLEGLGLSEEEKEELFTIMDGEDQDGSIDRDEYDRKDVEGLATVMTLYRS